jgi:hypothetical protein
MKLSCSVHCRTMLETQELSAWASFSPESSTVDEGLKKIHTSLVEEAQTLCELLNSAGLAAHLSPQPFSRVFKHEAGEVWAQGLLDNLRARKDVVRAALEQDIGLDDNRGLFWLACRRFNFKPSSEMLEKIKDSDVLEIYTLHDKKQIFSNFRFWDLVSYPIDDILSYEFYELFERSAEVNEGILNLVVQVATTQKTLPYTTAEHLVKEIHSPKEYVFRIRHGYMGPLIDRHSGMMTGVVSTLESVRIESQLSH